ncbi:MAG: hypothetical protein SGJ15_08810 [Bacteroidota bacterium]|nr:hypothetical protein [Bacteroidota bacterium]
MAFYYYLNHPEERLVKSVCWVVMLYGGLIIYANTKQKRRWDTKRDWKILSAVISFIFFIVLIITGREPVTIGLSLLVLMIGYDDLRKSISTRGQKTLNIDDMTDEEIKLKCSKFRMGLDKLLIGKIDSGELNLYEEQIVAMECVYVEIDGALGYQISDKQVIPLLTDEILKEIRTLWERS